MLSVCFVTCVTWPQVSASDALVQAALERRGIAVAARPWNGPVQDFTGFGAVLLRSNWDYHHAATDFVAWLDGLESAGVRVWNPPALVRWNVSKRYLVDLAARGIPTVPTAIIEDDAARRLPDVLAAQGWSRAVVKPTVSASAHDTVLVEPDTIGDVVQALRAGRIRQPVLVQPFLAEIRTRGEWSAILIEGEVTHTVLKRPGAGDFRVQPALGGTAERQPAPASVAQVARRTVAALPVPPLYARIDGVETAVGFQVMEVEVNEPGLFFPLAPEAAEIFADAIVRRAAR